MEGVVTGAKAVLSVLRKEDRPYLDLVRDRAPQIHVAQLDRLLDHVHVRPAPFRAVGEQMDQAPAGRARHGQARKRRQAGRRD